MKRIIAAVLAVMTALCASGCGNDQDNKQIEVPIYEAAATTYNTVKAEVTSITQKYIMTGNYTTPYTLKAKYAASGQIREIYVNQGQRVAKGDILCSLFTDDLDERIEEKKVYLDQAQLTYSKMLSTYNGKNLNEIEVSRIEYEIQKLEYEKLVESKDNYNVYAPCDGLFNLQMLNYGQRPDKFMWVNQGSTFGYVTDESETYITCTMHDQSLQSVNYGTRVEISQGDLSTMGIVSDIINRNKDYIYVIRPDKDVEFMSFGSMQVLFNIYSRDDVVVIPSSAIKTVGQRQFVNLLVDGVKIEQDVETGIVDGDKTEIVGGLIGGEEIILN